MEYRVVTAFRLNTMVKKMNEAINEGWKPLGGVCLDFTAGWAQAMTREVK